MRKYRPEIGRWMSRDAKSELGFFAISKNSRINLLRKERERKDNSRIAEVLHSERYMLIAFESLGRFNSVNRTNFVFPPLPYFKSLNPELEVYAQLDNGIVFVVNNAICLVDVNGHDWWPPWKWGIWPHPPDPEDVTTWPIPGTPTCSTFNVCGQEIRLCYWSNPDPHRKSHDLKWCCFIAIPW